MNSKRSISRQSVQLLERSGQPQPSQEGQEFQAALRCLAGSLIQNQFLPSFAIVEATPKPTHAWDSRSLATVYTQQAIGWPVDSERSYVEPEPGDYTRVSHQGVLLAPTGSLHAYRIGTRAYTWADTAARNEKLTAILNDIPDQLAVPASILTYHPNRPGSPDALRLDRLTPDTVMDNVGVRERLAELACLAGVPPIEVPQTVC